jgi:hypothetical protein
VRLLAALAVVIAMTPAAVFAQTAPPPPADEPSWEFAVSGSTYVVPDDSNFLQPTLTADFDWLHLEARYNYEALDTASAWVGYNFGGGETVTWELTPMLGAVLGATDGVAPGYKGSVDWKMLSFYSEGEFVIDTTDSADSFFYNWSELTLAPVESLRFGLVTQRTRVYQTDREIQRGLLAGFSFKALDVTGYVFNPDDEKPTYVLTVAVTF